MQAWKPIAFVVVLAVASLTLWADGVRDLGDFPPNDRKVLMLALEGMDWNTVSELIAAGRLPNLAKISTRAQVVPIAGGSPSLLAPSGMHPSKTWATLFTGHHPSAHNVQMMPVEVNHSYLEIPITSVHRRKLALWEILSGAGLRCAVVGNWGTWPAEWVNGYLVSDRFFLAEYGLGPFSETGHPDLGQIDDAYRGPADYVTFPDPLAAELAEQLPEVPSQHAFLQQLKTLRRRETDATLQSSLEMLANAVATDLKVAQTLSYLLEKDPEIQFATCTFNAFDVAAPLFFKYSNPLAWRTHSNPRVRAQLDPDQVPRYQDLIPMTLVTIDGLIGRLLQTMGDDTTVVLVSGHGFEASLDPNVRRLSLNGILERLGFLQRNPDGTIRWGETVCFDREMQPWRIIRLLSLNFEDLYPQGIVPPPDSESIADVNQRWAPVLAALDSVKVEPSWRNIETGKLEDGLFIFKAPNLRQLQLGVYMSFPEKTRVSIPGVPEKIPVSELFPPIQHSAKTHSTGFLAVAFPGEEGRRAAARVPPMGQEFASRVWVAPTVVTMFGLPLGKENIEMDDKALLWLFDSDKAQQAAIRRIQSYERTVGRFEEGTEINRRYRQMKEHLVEIGYVTIKKARDGETAPEG